MKSERGNRIVPFRGRALDYARPVYVYRNLRGSRSCKYSILQGALVVAHTNQILLQNCRFVVHELGRQRVLATKRKNVHAFIRGRVARNPASASHALNLRVRYNPYEAGYFFIAQENWQRMPVHCARAVCINDEHGITAMHID